MAEASPTRETTLARNWWAPALRGAAAMIFGLVVWFWPGLALQTVILIFAIYSICSGILNMAEAVLSVADRQRWIPLALEGALSMGAGTVALVWPDLAAKTFLVLIAIWAILTGVLNLVSAVRLREEISDEWLLVLTGLTGIIFGTVAIARPQSGALAVLWLIGAFGIIIGVLMIATGWQLRRRQINSTVESTVQSGTKSADNLESARATSDLTPAQQARATTSPPAGAAAPSAIAGVASAGSIEGSASSSEFASRLGRRERALNELIKALPPEGEGWRRGDGGLTAPDGYPLKGNINSRIYHAPGGQSYHETIAEVYFASDEVAHRAGFRPRKEPDRAAAESQAADATKVSGQPDSQPSPLDGLDLADDQVLDLEVLTIVEQPEPVGMEEESPFATLDEEPGITPEVPDIRGETREGEATPDQVSSSDSSADDSAAAYESFEDAELATFDAELDEAMEETLAAGEKPGRDPSELDVSSPTAEPTNVDSERMGDSIDAETNDASELELHEDATTEPDLEPATDGITVVDAASDLTSSTGDAPSVDKGGIETSEAIAEVDDGGPEITIVDDANDFAASKMDATEVTEDECAVLTKGDEAPVDPELEAILASLPPEGAGWARGDGEYDCPEDFPVKGNVSSMIFHVPGGGSYGVTIPNICFSTTEIAEKAGFRGAKNQGS